ncbi:ATP-binding protein [Mesorhizobium sp. M1A.F.Ca.ET.072.01.1.1]|uniref:protein DpdH n=1 Tax=Mesorhizobium sp. M1A.F.Ca.ET.072.01.1.1 TaxID=2496753 RepID=UPI000FD43F22|nr:protein DpdH [Mesorhizobium sp. M1A.F.Ca.ET.072.01.1.1]RUW54562.1 ATP-binding protein [Mesorhizobium sp. M1A.F.Ca.ET.072.01.1.1]
MLEKYWPEPDRVNACIKNEAETADVSVLLAVHQPTPLTTRNAGTNIETPASEQELLDAFLSDDVPGGYLLFPITGPSGVGKSHIIRWLDAQLQRSPRRERLHIIRIPKSASLRRVVELIIEPLAGDLRFEKSRSDLSRAVAEVDKRKAVVLFRAQIENALASRAEALVIEAREHKERAAELRPLIGHAQMLPKLFGDAALKDHFDETVLARVVARALQGREDGVEGDETQSQFFAEDLILPDEIDLNNAALPVKTYYQTQLAVQDVRRRQSAADLLNTIVDTAIGNVFQLEQSTGGITLQDIILGVREILLKDDMDLVLLVEDFAALSGIQDVLLKVCVQEGTHDGKKVRATMRTALALTDGYLASRDTILTRAQRVWVIGNREQSDDEIKSAVIEMVGAYLNAARWGEDGLRKRFDRRGSGDGLTGWLPAWHDEAQRDEEGEALRAFGFSTRGHALFPFNRLAVEQLVQRHLGEGSRLVFNPRRVINEILRRPLLMRSTFVTGNFPPPDFHGLRPSVYLAGLIRQASQPEPVKRRLASALAVWGGNAADQTALAHVPPAIFTTFSLPTLTELANVAFVPERDSTAPVRPTGGEDANPLPPPLTPAPEQDPRVAAWSKKLDAWASGTELVQADARELRSALAAMLKGAINWPALRMPDEDIKATWLSIAGARNNPVSGRILVVCDRREDEDGTLREGFLGALRFGFNGHRWNYPEADVDYVASAAIIDHLVDQLVPILVAETKAQAAVVARALLNQSRIIGLAPPVRAAGAEALLRGLFSPPPQVETQTFEDGWDQLRTQALGSVNGRSTRVILQGLLLDRSASFQGSGNKPFAIDSPRLLDVLAGDPPAGPLPEGLPEEARTLIPTLTDARLWGKLQAVIAKLRTFRAEIADFVDEDLDKNAFVANLREIIPLLQKTNCWPSGVMIKQNEFEARLTEFQTSRFVDLVDKTATIVDEADREQIPKLLNALGSLDLGLIQRTMSFLTIANEIVTQAAPRVAQQLTIRGQSDPSNAAAEIASLLEGVSGSQPALLEAEA